MVLFTEQTELYAKEMALIRNIYCATFEAYGHSGTSRRPGMARRKPCAVCDAWFTPHPRLGNRQHTCGRQECRKEWHRRSCRKWHKAKPDYDRHTRLVQRLVKDDPPGPRGRPPDPLTAIDWDYAREEIGLGVAALVEEAGKVVLRAARDAIPA
jgi:hypothetical protein